MKKAALIYHTRTQFQSRKIKTVDAVKINLLYKIFNKEVILMPLPVALQLYTVRDYISNDLLSALKSIKEIGYDYLEVSDILAESAEEYRNILNNFGFSVTSMHASIESLISDVNKNIENCIALGSKYIVIPYLAGGIRPGVAEFDDILKKIIDIGNTCKKSGIQLLYHNHDFEFEKISDGSFGLDYLYKTIPAELLAAQLDVCWVGVAGQDPVAYINKYKNRVPVLHIKDYYGTKSNGFEFRPIGHGIQDMASILDEAIKAGTKYVVVEQDFAVGMTSMEAAKLSREYLKSIGW